MVFVEWILFKRMEQWYFKFLLLSQVLKSVISMFILPLNFIDYFLNLIMLEPIDFL